MKHLIILIILLLSCAANICNAQFEATYAQDIDAEATFRQKIGIQFGYNCSTINGTAVYGKMKTGINVGVTTDISLTDKWLVRPGILLTMKGFQMECGKDDFYNKDFNFLEMPVLAVYQIGVSDNCSVELQCGPYFSYGLFGKSDSPFYYYKVNTFSVYKSFDWGANFGVGLNVFRFYIGASYDFGFVSVIHHALHHCIMANVGFRIM